MYEHDNDFLSNSEKKTFLCASNTANFLPFLCFSAQSRFVSARHVFMDFFLERNISLAGVMA